MARLTAAARRRIPSSKFAGPGRSFPVEDRNHAIAAERLAPRSEAKGNITPAQEHRIVARARAVLHPHGVEHVTEHHRKGRS